MASLLAYDNKVVRSGGLDWIVGVDEVGRGAFAGPVVAAAVAIPCRLLPKLRHRSWSKLVNDSKRLNAGRREAIESACSRALASRELFRGIGRAESTEIDAVNILQATREAMIRAIRDLVSQTIPDGLVLPSAGHISEKKQSMLWDWMDGPAANSRILIDGRPFRSFPYAHEGVVGGDGKSFCIALASILAKVHRDRLMAALPSARVFGWESNKGYGTESHRSLIRVHGLDPQHRLSFVAEDRWQRDPDDRQIECF